MKRNDEISTQEAAELLGCTLMTVHRMIRRGSIKRVRRLDPNVAKSRVRLERKEIEDLVRRQKTGPLKLPQS